jgi:hypothetical protein
VADPSSRESYVAAGVLQNRRRGHFLALWRFVPSYRLFGSDLNILLADNQDLAVRRGAGLKSHWVKWSDCAYTDHESRLSELTPGVVPAGSAPWGRLVVLTVLMGVVISGVVTFMSWPLVEAMK